MQVSLIGGGARLYLKPLSHGHYGKFFVSGLGIDTFLNILKYLKQTSIMRRCAGYIGKINNSICHPELAAPLVADVKEAYKGGGSQSNSGACHRQKCSTICTQKSNVGLKAQPTLISVSHRWRSILMQDLRPHSPRKAAFTLAEVLITLGIIGVVAALTLPALLANQRKIEYASRLKKFNSTMSQAILMAQKDYGEPTNWDSPGEYLVKDENGAPALDDDGKEQYDDVKGSQNSYNMVMKYIAPYIKYLKIEEYNPTEKRTGIYFSDGSIAWVKTGACYDFKFDVNGNNRPNMEGYDRYLFSLCAWDNWENSGEKYTKFFGKSNIYWGTLMEISKGRNDRQRALQLCKTTPYHCARLLELDGWEYKRDYPYKI